MTTRSGKPGNEPEGFEVIHATLSRMGTGSIAAAYQTLGYKTHHYHQPGTPSDWMAFEDAVDGKWPNAPGARPRPKFTRADWEAMRGDYDIFTDFTAHFSPDLIRAYPDAKVVIVQRDFDSWWESYRERCIDSIDSKMVDVISSCMKLFQGGYSMVEACRKQYYGFFGVTNLRDIDQAIARRAYDDFFAEIRDLVPPEQRLEYNVQDGWEPLCKFLDKEIPDEPFPWVNTRSDHQQMERRYKRWYGYIGLSMLAGAIAVGASLSKLR